jgi:phytol kinase
LAREVAGLTIVGLSALAILLVAGAWRAAGNAPPEWTRKFVHVGVGALAGCLPWVFDRPASVLVLTLGSVSGMLLARRLRAFPALLEIDRHSLGEIYFPISVAVLYLLAHHRPILYLISIYTMVVCDALAAILGKGYGKHSYLVTTDRKTFEGTAIFLLFAFLGVHIPLLLLTDVDRTASVLIATQIALLVTCFEAISVAGIDNLVVPLGTYYLLVKMTPQPAASVGQSLLVQVALLAATLLLAWRTRFLTFSGALAAHLVLYGCYALGGARWMVAPVVALTAFLVLDAYGNRGGRERHAYHVAAIFHMSVVAVVFLFLDNTFAPALSSGRVFYAPFVGALAASLAAGAFLSLGTGPRRLRSRPWLRAGASLALGIGLVVPFGLLVVRNSLRIADVAAAAILGALSLAFFLVLRRGDEHADLIRQFRLVSLSALGAAAIVLPLHLIWLGAVGWARR